MTRDCKDDANVAARIESAGNAFGALRRCLFSSPSISFAAKKLVYTGLILSILLHGVETWCLTEKLFHDLRLFHAQCTRAMCRVNRIHTRKYHISTVELLERVGLSSIDAYITKSQLRWAGHVSRMSMERLPRKMMTCWVRNPRPKGCPQFTYGRGVYKALAKVEVDRSEWTILAQDREQWRKIVSKVI